MSFRRAVNWTGISTLLFATAALIATGCGSSGGSSGTGGATGAGGKNTGGKTGSGGVTGSGGATGMGGSAAMPTCTPLAGDANNPVIMAFDDPTKFTFGDGNTTLSGTLLQFNGGTPDLMNGTWNIDQMVTGYGDAGIGIDFQPCPEADLSAFTGLAFDISGTISAAMDGVDAGPVPAQRVSFQVSTAEDDVASNYDSTGQFAASFGLCVPKTGNQYDGSCATPSVNVPIAPGTPVTKSYTWSQITGGQGQPSGRATPNPAKITHIRWIFPFDGMTPFHINLTIDNFRGLTAGGTTTDAGTDTTTPPPPADAGTDATTD